MLFSATKPVVINHPRTLLNCKGLNLLAESDSWPGFWTTRLHGVKIPMICKWRVIRLLFCHKLESLNWLSLPTVAISLFKVQQKHPKSINFYPFRSVLKYLIHDNEYFRPFLFKNLPLGPNTLNFVPQTSMLYPHKKLILLEVNEVQ
jgi:hypothetical protein